MRFKDRGSEDFKQKFDYETLVTSRINDCSLCLMSEDTSTEQQDDCLEILEGYIMPMIHRNKEEYIKKKKEIHDECFKQLKKLSKAKRRDREDRLFKKRNIEWFALLLEMVKRSGLSVIETVSVQIK